MITYGSKSITVVLNKTVHKYENNLYTLTIDGVLKFQMLQEEIESIVGEEDSKELMTAHDYLTIAMGIYIEANR